jgi:uncharacterized protein (TIGR00725 family)
MSLPPDVSNRLSHKVIEVVGKLAERQASGGRCAQPIAIIGPGDGGAKECMAAYELARVLGRAGVPIVCGGRGGVMAAASRGASDVGGIAIGVLPEENLSGANPFLTVALPTGMGEMRNGVIARSAFCIVAIGGGMGTLSEMALGLKWGKPLFTLHEEYTLRGAKAAGSLDQLIEWVLQCALEQGG